MNFRTSRILAISAVLLLAFPALLNAQAPRPNGEGGRSALQAVQPDSPTEKSRGSISCPSTFRLLNGVCTNPFFKLWGSTNRAHSSLFFTHSSKFPTGSSLPSARFASNMLCKQTMDVFNARKLNELAVFFGQFLDHTFVATPAGKEKMPITIPADDPIFGNFSGGVLKFTRSERARVDFLGLFGSGSPKLATQIPKVIAKDPDLGKSPGVAKALPGTRGSPSTVGLGPSQARVRQGKIKINPDSPIKPSEPGPNEAPSPGRFQFYLRNERPVNSLTSAVDLSSVYGVDNRRNDALRSKIGGKLLTSGADFLPLNNPMLSNAPTSEKIYFLAGDHRSNEHPMLTTFHTIFVREHNSICDELKASFPTWSDQMLYENARRINSAQFQKIVFEEFYPAMTGRNLSPYSGFKFYRNVNIIDIFSTAAFRVGHTMIGNKVSRRGPGNAPLPGLNMEDMFFRVASKLMPGDMENFLRGAMQTNAQEVDLMVHDALRDFLFTGIPEEGVAIDLISLNIQRGRDHALPTLNQIRARLGITPASSFSDISSNLNTQLRLASVYSNVNQVEAWPGMVAEDHVSGSSMGKTMLAVWDRQFLNLRDGDRFFYKNIVFDASLKAAVPRINRISTAPELLREIILRNTDVAAGELPPQIFFKR